MARGVLVDYMGLAGTELKLTDSADGATVQTAEGGDERGDFQARETFESLTAPSNGYTVCADFDVAAGLILGTLVDGLTEPDIITTGFDIATSAGVAPTVTASGGSVPTASVEGYTYTVPAQTILSDHIAQILFSAFTLTPAEGNYLQSCNASVTCNLSRGLNEDGETCSWDVQAAKIEVTAEINQYESTAPTVTPAASWATTSPLSSSETNTDYEKWTITLTFTPTAVAPTP